MEAKTKTILLGVGIGILAYVLINKKSKMIVVENKSKADGNDDLANTGAFSYVDGEFYNADGDFYGADGNFYDADGSFIGNDGEFAGVGEDENDTMSFADGGKKKLSYKMRIGKAKHTKNVRSLAIWKRRLGLLMKGKAKLVAKKKTTPKQIAHWDKKIAKAKHTISLLEQKLSSPQNG